MSEVYGATIPNVTLLVGRSSLLDWTAEADLLAVCCAKGVPLVLGGLLTAGILATCTVPHAKFNYKTASLDILARVVAVEGFCMDHGTSLLSAALTFSPG